MNSDLMHPPGEWFAKNHGGSSIVAKSPELCVTILASRTDLAHTNLVAHNFNGLLANHRVTVFNKLDSSLITTQEPFFT
jgi:hypothetical protein